MAESDVETINFAQTHFRFLKQASLLDELWTKAIRVSGERGYLFPLGHHHLEDPEFSEGEWLRREVLEQTDRIYFLILDRWGGSQGKLGLSCEKLGHLELLISELPSPPPHFDLVLEALLKWAEQTLFAESVRVQVAAENPWLAFFRSCPLAKEESGSWFRLLSSAGSVGNRMILTAGPSISARELLYSQDAVRTGWNQSWNEYIRRFEKAFAEYIGVKHALSTSSCTGALHLSLLGLGVGPGDEVIVPDITWVATANAVLYTGAKPVFADVDPDHWCLDPTSLESKITSKTKAVIPVHLYGQPAPMSPIVELCQRHGLPVVEDAAPAIGALYRGQKVGTFGAAACFSFQGAKLTVTGEGGMLVTNDSDLYERVVSLWDQGRDPHRTFWINRVGWKYKMANPQAALGLAQLERVEELIYAKRRLFQWYQNRLKSVTDLQLCAEAEGTRSIYWMASAKVLPSAKLSRDGLMAELKARNVDTRPVFPAISQYPIWGYTPTVQSVAKQVGQTCFNLPSGVCLREDEVDYVCTQIRDLLGER